MNTITTTLYASNPHDNGFDLLASPDITSRPVGRIHVDRSDPRSPVAVVVRIPAVGREAEGDREIVADNTIEANEELRRIGWHLDANSFSEVSDLLADAR